MRKPWWIIPALLMLLGNEILSLLCLCILAGAGVAALFKGMADHNF